MSPPADSIRIKNMEWKTSIMISTKICPPLQGLFSWGESQGVSPVASSTYNNLLQDVYNKSGKEVRHEGHSTFHTLVIKAHGSSYKSEPVILKPVISRLQSSSKLKQGANSTFYNGGFCYILCPLKLQVQRVNNREINYLKVTVLTTEPVTNISGSVKDASKHNLGGGVFYKHNLPEADLEDADFNKEEHVSHILAAKAHVISTESGLTMQRSDPSILSLFSGLKSGGVPSLSSRGFSLISCHPQLREPRDTNAENINLKDVVLIIPPVSPVKHSVKQARDLLTNQTYF